MVIPRGGIAIKVIRRYPIYLYALERAVERVKMPELNEVREELYRQQAGYFGEIASDKYVRRTRIPGIVFTDIQIEAAPGEFIQIDTLILTQRAIWLIEAKKYKGALRYLHAPKRIERTERDGSVMVFPCPIVQLESQMHALKGWLDAQGIDLPVFGTVAFASTNRWEGLPEEAPIIPVREIPAYLEGTYRELNDCLTPEAFGQIAEKLGLQKNLLVWEPVCKRLGINANRLKRGFLCPDCHTQLTRATERTGHCKNCDRNVKTDYAQLILDWFLLIHPTLNNAQLRAFAKLKTKQAASRILNRYELLIIGASTGTTYKLNPYTDLEGLEIRKGKPRREVEKEVTTHSG